MLDNSGTRAEDYPDSGFGPRAGRALFKATMPFAVERVDTSWLSKALGANAP